MRPRPKILLDIKGASGVSPFDVLPRRLNLFFRKPSRFGLRLPKAITTFIITVSAVYFATGALAPIITTETLAQTDNPQEEQVILKQQLDAYEKEINDLENKIQESQKKGASLKNEIGILNTKISKINLQIKAVNLSIENLNNEVASTSDEIQQKEANISSNKDSIANTLASIYISDKTDTIQMLLKSRQLSDFFGNVNNLASVQENLRAELDDLVASRDQLIDEKDRLDLEKADKEAVKVYQDTQKAAIQQLKSEKDNLLQVTKGQESKFKNLAIEKKKAAAEIRNKIFRLLGGGELQFGEAVKIAQVAEKATGVRAAFILSVLTQESSVNGVIGKNLGKCYYNTPQNNFSGTVMSDKQKPIFLSILADLGASYNPDTTPVSCPIVRDGQYGGAMGPAQFLPSTWNLYKDRVSKITGGNPANPFNNLDAFTATALYVDDGLEGCKNIYSTGFSQESCAAAKYYAGAKWRSYMSPGRYGYRVADRARDIEKDIETILLASSQ